MKQFERDDWKKSMKIKFDFNNMMEHTIGSEGIKDCEIDALKQLIAKAYSSFKLKAKSELEWTNLPNSQEDTVKEVLKIAEEIKENYDNFVLLGIGGQALGPIAVHEALNHAYYNELPKEKRHNCPRFYVPDNVDPERMSDLLDIIDVEKTKFLISSKSGNTSETLSQFMIIVDMLKQKLGNKHKENIICITNSKKGTLLDIIKKEGYKYLVMPEGVGGRFSILSSSGLLPAAVSGIDIEELLQGAAFMEQCCSKENSDENPAMFAAVLQYISMKKGKNISVLIPYSHALRYISDWYAQLWAESLGKRIDNDGNEVFVGQTPVKALGVTDQHSQIQLYTEGPFDKTISFIRVAKFRKVTSIPDIYCDISGVSFMGNRSLNELINAEEYATEYALTKAKRMNNTVIIPEINAFTIGQLLYYYEMQTAFMGELLNIDAYNQPGVEEGKLATFALLGRVGYKEKKKELENAPAKLEKYIL